MNPAIHAAIIASQKHQQGVDDVVSKLRKARALSAASAIALTDVDQTKIDEAVGLGLVIRSADGRLHVNEHAVSDRLQSQGWIVIVILLVAASLIASAVALLAT
jgi:hypothetical protein